MDKIDRQQIVDNTRRLEEWENTPPALSADYDDMSNPELIKLIEYLQSEYGKAEQRAERAEARAERAEQRAERAEQREVEMLSMLRESHAKADEQMRLIEELRKMLAESDKKQKDAENQSKADRANRFASKSQKGMGKRKDNAVSQPESDDNGDGKNEEIPSAEEQKEDFYGPGSVEILPESDCVDEDGNLNLPVPGVAKPSGKGSRPYRAGKKHNKPHADVVRELKSDKSKLPSDYKFLRYVTKTVLTKKTIVYQTDYQLIEAIDKDGQKVEIWLPEETGQIEPLDRVPGTSADAETMSDLVIDHCVLNVP